MTSLTRKLDTFFFVNLPKGISLRLAAAAPAHRRRRLDAAAGCSGDGDQRHRDPDVDALRRAALAARYDATVESFGPWLLLILLLPVSYVLAPVLNLLTRLLFRMVL